MPLGLYVKSLRERKNDLGTVTFDYDEYGRCIRITSKQDSVMLTTINYTYENGEPITTVTREREFDRRQDVWKYNSEGILLQQDIITYKAVTERNGMNLPGGETVQRIRFQYEDNGHTVIRTEYGKTGNPLLISVSKADPYGHLITSGRWDSFSEKEYTGPDSLEYNKSNPCDAEGRVTEIYSPVSSGSDKTFLNVTVTYLDDGSRSECEYDATGHEISKTVYDGNNKVKERFDYAADNTVAAYMKESEARADGSYTKTFSTHTASGSVASKVISEYTADDRLLSERFTNEEGSEYRVITYHYDEAGHLLKIEDTQGLQSEIFEYDDNGNLIYKTRKNTSFTYEQYKLSPEAAAEKEKFYFNEELIEMEKQPTLYN